MLVTADRFSAGIQKCQEWENRGDLDDETLLAREELMPPGCM